MRKILIALSTFIIIVACDSEEKDLASKTIKEEVNIQAIDSFECDIKQIALESSDDFFLATSTDSSISVCCSGNLFTNVSFDNIKDNGLLNKDTLVFDIEGKNRNVLKFSFKNQLELRYTEDYEGEMDLIYGRIEGIKGYELLYSNGFTSKEKLVKSLFKSSKSNCFTGISIYEVGYDEMGELRGTYFFKGEKLQKVIFSSDYDWGW